ncbi:hypothetical protein RHSIM_Rhsim07G0195400 [Rhododendron simsii]|uniref:Gnk2-homologous domain-containing protein n=1 Tax=Rhododendron simsii TaxID=118357 RepID=A0A834LJX4_RHOSS|nr:hypothetical protein RHSIM_Rhsim07G0195400 [Rhododendron simsii]
MWNLGNASNVNEFNQALRSLFDDLRSRAVSGGAHIKFATGNTPGPDLGTIYGLMQCTPDLSEMDCNNCLLWAVEQILQYFGGETGGSILTPSCNLRYQTYQFFTEIPADAPPATSGPQPSPPPARTFAPPPPSTNVTTKQVFLETLIHMLNSCRHGKLGGKEHIQMSALRLNSGFMLEMIRCIHIGLLCVQENVAKRPPMASVVLMLSSSSISLEVPSEPGFFLHSGSNNAELPLLQEHRFEFAVSGHSTNEVSTTELYPR